MTEKIREQPDITLHELIDEFNLPISQSALCRRLRKLGLTFKKKTLRPSKQTINSKSNGSAHNLSQNTARTNTSTMYWFDESSANCGMTRLCGRAFSYERMDEYVSDVRFECTLVAGVLGLEVVVASLLFKVSLNGCLVVW
jgi:arginine repressor